MMIRFRDIVFIIVLGLCPSIVIAQDCKFDIDKKDARTNEVQKLVTYSIGPSSYDWKFLLEEKGEKYFIGMVIKWAGRLPKPFAKGEKVFITLDDGKIVELVANKDYPPNYAVDRNGEPISSYFPKGEIKKNTLGALSNSRIVKLVVRLDGDDKEIRKISGSQAEDIMQSAKCMLQ